MFVYVYLYTYTMTMQNAIPLLYWASKNIKDNIKLVLYLNKKCTFTMKYKESGVDIESGNIFVNNIKEKVTSTFSHNVISKLGGFSGLFDITEFKNFDNPILVSSTDGVGTKIIIAKETNNYHNIGIDLVAMSVNDIICNGAKPLFFLDYIATWSVKDKGLEYIIDSIAKACISANISLIGGETAEMPDLYKKGEIDLAGFCLGIVEKNAILPKKEAIDDNDIIIGIRSSGIHSNGFSLIRKIFKDLNISYSDKCEIDLNQGKCWGDILLEPTRIYSNIFENLKEKMKENNIEYDGIKAIAHVTGGGIIGNLSRTIPDNKKICMNYTENDFPPLFKWVMENGNIPSSEMLEVFNCGVGIVFITHKNNREFFVKELKEDFIDIGFISNDVS